MSDKLITQAKVNFIILGAQKSGTTTLADLLSQNPQVCFCKQKEPGFFSNDDWKSNLPDYQKLFEVKAGQLLGEASTRYTFFPEFPNTVENIYSYNSEMKFIYLMRSPVERIVSHYAHRLVRKRTKGSIEEEVLGNPAYVNISKYHSQISPYINRFGMANVLLLVFEDFIRNPSIEMLKVCNFLNIDHGPFEYLETAPVKNQSSEVNYVTDRGQKVLHNRMVKLLPYHFRIWLKSWFLNSLNSKPQFPTSLKKKLYDQLSIEVHQVESMLGREIKEWKRY